MHPSVRSHLRRAAAGIAMLLAGLGLAAPAPAQVAFQPTPPAAARLWFYRDFFAGDTQDMPAVSMNGALTGYALPGTSFYREVPAGQYHITVASEGEDLNQAKTIALAPGEVLYLKIASAPNWLEGGGPNSDWRRGTYYVMIVPPQLAAHEIALTRQTNGS